MLNSKYNRNNSDLEKMRGIPLSYFLVMQPSEIYFRLEDGACRFNEYLNIVENDCLDTLERSLNDFIHPRGDRRLCFSSIMIER